MVCKFVRYADDCVIFTKSRKSANRVMNSITKFIERKLKLKVNRTKSKVDRPWRIKYRRIFFLSSKRQNSNKNTSEVKAAKFKEKIREITSRSNAMSMETRYLKLKQVIVGWVNYFKIANMGNIAQKLDEWIRRRIRMCYWKQWKRIKTKHDNLVKICYL
ncbi:MAG: group II intron maturase-specific domain-containing protein [Clostridia bacterium]